MNDKKTSDDDFFEDDFNEDIDFEEENFEIPAKEKSSSTGGGPKGSQTPFIVGVAVAIVVVISYFGYRFYMGPEKSKPPARPLIAQVPAKPKPQPKPVTPKATPVAPAPEKSVAKSATPPSVTTTTTTTTTKGQAPKPPSFDEKDLEKFLSGDQTTTTIAIKPGELKPSPPTKPAVTAAQQVSGAQQPGVQQASTAQQPGAIQQMSGAQPTGVQTPSATQMAEGTAVKVTAVETKPITSMTPDKKLAEQTPSDQIKISESVKPTPAISVPLEKIPSSEEGAAGIVAAKSSTATVEKSATIQEMQRDLFTDKPVTTPVTTVTTDKPVIKEIKPSEIAKAPLIPLAPPPSTENQQIKEIKDQTKEAMEALARLNQQMENNLNQIKSLDAYTRDVSQTVAKLNSDISAMDNRLLALTNAATSLSKDIGQVRGEVGTVRRSMREDTLDVSTIGRRKLDPPTILVEEPEYVIHAVIPGRAWIKSSKGQILTVSEGDSLGNYGKVIIIDAASAVVLTSSGVAIR